MSKSKKNINFTVDASYNRASLLTGFPLGMPLHFVIKYHKNIPSIQFKILNIPDKIKDKTISVQIFRNLENSNFAKVFLHLENVSDDERDGKFIFRGINRSNEKYIIQFTNEKYDLNNDYKDAKKNNNYLLILGWKLQGFDEEFLYYFIQRKVYNKFSKQIVTRSAALQFSTERVLKKLDEFTKDNENRIRKINKQDDLSFLDEVLK